MTTPLVTEDRLPLEPVSPDPFLNGLEEPVRPPRPADATGTKAERSRSGAPTA
jgi:hypothetical protein